VKLDVQGESQVLTAPVAHPFAPLLPDVFTFVHCVLGPVCRSTCYEAVLTGVVRNNGPEFGHVVKPIPDGLIDGVIVTISLSEEFNESHYKLIAVVSPLGEGE